MAHIAPRKILAVCAVARSFTILRAGVSACIAALMALL